MKVNVKKIVSTLMMTLIAIVLAAFIGCSGFQDALTPCYIDESVGEYTEEEMTSFLPYTTLFDAKRLKRCMDWMHLTKQEAFQRLQEDDVMLYTFLNDGMVLGMQDAEQFKHTVFDPTGPIGLMMTTLLGGTLGATLISKPGDKKEIEKLKNGNTPSP